MKKALVILSICIVHFSNAQNKAFDYLDQYIIDEGSGYADYQIAFHYNSKVTSEILFKKLGELEKDHPLFTEDEFIANECFLLAKTFIDKYNEYFIVFSFGPSMDPTYSFHHVNNPKEGSFSIATDKIFIPGNGNIYTSGIIDQLFETKKKYKLEGKEILEVDQPFYSVGLETKTLKNIQVYESTSLEKIVANLPANYSIKVLLNKKESNLFLIETEFGLTGWVEITEINLGRNTIDGIYFHGD